MQDTLELGVRGLAAVQGLVVWSYESAPRDECFGGWPAAALVPTTPLRLLRFDVRTMWPVPIPDVEVRAASFLSGAAGYAPDVSFERRGQLLDPESTLGELCEWAAEGDRTISVLVNGVRVPLHFEPKYARRGAEAGADTLRQRRPLDALYAFLTLGVVSVIYLCMLHRSDPARFEEGTQWIVRGGRPVEIHAQNPEERAREQAR